MENSVDQVIGDQTQSNLNSQKIPSRINREFEESTYTVLHESNRSPISAQQQSKYENTPKINLMPPKESQLLLDNVHVQSLKKTYWRWIQLTLIALYTFCTYFQYQILTVLQSQIIFDLHINQALYNTAMALYSVPNIIAPLFVPLLTQRLGMRIPMAFYCISMLGGVFVQFLAVQIPSYIVLLLGIILFGIGINGSVVLFNSFTAIWFEGAELSTALSVFNCFQYTGMVFTSISLPEMYDKYHNLEAPFLFAVVVMGSALPMLAAMLFIDYKTEQHEKRYNIVGVEAELGEEEQLNIRDVFNVKRFGFFFWLVNLSTFIGYANQSYNNNIQALLNELYGLSYVIAGRYIALQFIIQLPLTPLIGILTDKYGKRAQLYILGAVFNSAQFVLFAAAPACDYNPNIKPQPSCALNAAWYIVPLVLGGIGNSFYGAINAPMIALLVEQRDLNLAFGFYDSLYQLGQGTAPFPLGVLLDKHGTPKYGFQYFYYWNFGISILLLLNTIWIYLYDLKNGQLLEKRQEIIPAFISHYSKARRTLFAQASHIKLVQKSFIAKSIARSRATKSGLLMPPVEKSQ